MLTDRYIVVINKSTPVGRLKGHQIYKVASTEFLPLRERQVTDVDEETYLAYLSDLLRTGPMYFSYSFDLTNSFQRQTFSDSSEPLWQRADDRFFWNRFICSSLIELRRGEGQGRFRSSTGPQPSVDPYILPVVFGMLSITNTSIKGNAMTFVLITRRSRHRAGTRYLSRGIDEHGHVSNFNETEQSVILNDQGYGGLTSFAGDQGFQNKGPIGGKETQVLSYVQTRGSVPVYWAEINTLKYTPRLTIRGVQTAEGAARRHFDEQIGTYGENYMVNLVNQRGRELDVKDAYEQIIKVLQSASAEEQQACRHSSERFHILDPKDQRSWYDHLHYVYFDFHNETKGLKWHRAQLLLDQLKEGLVAGGYFHGIDTPSGSSDTRNRQTAVVRTNCMDCLDRTNVVQSMLGRWTLTRMLIDLGILRPGESAQDDQNFEMLFRNVWADNADVVSKSYSGTGALKTDFTRTGTRTRGGMLQDLNSSVTRYFRNNFLDGPRQDGFDLFLGAYQPDGGLASMPQFVDRRPVVIQSVPYVLGMCVFFIFVGAATNRAADATVWPLRLFTVCCLGVAGYTGRFMWNFGPLYVRLALLAHLGSPCLLKPCANIIQVNWPKLATPSWATEAYQDTLERATKDPVVGSMLSRGAKGDARLGSLEEGKKRRE